MMGWDRSCDTVSPALSSWVVLYSLFLISYLHILQKSFKNKIRGKLTSAQFTLGLVLVLFAKRNQISQAFWLLGDGLATRSLTKKTGPHGTGGCDLGSKSAVFLQAQKFLALDEAKVELSTLGQIPAEMKFSWRVNKGFTRERSILYQELKLLGLVRRSNTINIYWEKILIFASAFCKSSPLR